MALPSANSQALADVPGLSRLVIPKITIASLAVSSVMGGIGYGLSRVPKTKTLGNALVIAACIGAGYAISEAIVTNIAPDITANGKAPGG